MAEDFCSLKRKSDLKSFAELLNFHADLLKEKRSTKGVITQDQQTLQIAQDIITRNGQDFSYILQKPNYATNDLGSVRVLIDDIRNYPHYEKVYQKNKDLEVMVCVGGPACEDQALIASMIPEIKKRLDKIIYITRNYAESNSANSAKQYHIRHANALNADPSLTGRNIIKSVVKRALFGMSNKEILSANFLKIDVRSMFNAKNLPIYLGNELNSIVQQIREMMGKLTEHDVNRISAFLGGEFFKILEDKMGYAVSGRKDFKISQHPSSIRVAFDKEESLATEKENEFLKKINIPFCELNSNQINDFFGHQNQIYKAYGYETDTHLKFSIHQINKRVAKDNGVEWIEDLQINKVLLTYEDNLPKVAGIVDEKGNFIYASKLHFSGGYRVGYFYANSLKNALRNNLTIATGVSINAIFRKRENFGEISATNSHWTKIAQDENYALVRITGGGNTGSEEYNPAYFINLIANSRRIFGDDLVGIVSAYGCSRAINAKNSSEWAELANGFIVSYGKGGTGNTKRHFEALKALYKLGFDREIVEFCNHYQSSRGGLLGDRLDEIIKLSNIDFSYDAKKRTAKMLNFDK